MRRLNNKVAVITGGAGGIGTATAQLFAEQGARVVLVDVDETSLNEVERKVAGAAPDAQLASLAVDLGEEDSAKTVIKYVLERFGGIDILINNAGLRSYEPLDSAKAETWDRLLSVNLLSYAYLSREALPALRSSGKGCIVNVSSTHAFNPRAGMGQYDVTKAGIISLTKTLAFEEAGNGVRVNAVCPGATLTPFHVRRFASAGKSEDDLRSETLDQNIQRRWADPREIAFPILWLASEEASFITASVIMADGGTRV
jgi:2-hydroxycyclohexanecarboxyl-CoA dehydrogenase